MSSTTTFKARNNHIVTVDGKLWSLSQALLAKRPLGRLEPLDACSLLRAVEPEGDLDDQKRTLRHIRRYFRWSKHGGKALETLMSRAGALRWSEEGVEQAIGEAGLGPKLSSL